MSMVIKVGGAKSTHIAPTIELYQRGRIQNMNGNLHEQRYLRRHVDICKERRVEVQHNITRKR